MPGRQYTATAYRYGFSGKEKDDEVKGSGNSINFGERIHDPRLGRFVSVDPLSQHYSWNSPYSYAENRVIDGIDIDGKGWGDFIAPIIEKAKGYAVQALETAVTIVVHEVAHDVKQALNKVQISAKNSGAVSVGTQAGGEVKKFGGAYINTGSKEIVNYTIGFSWTAENGFKNESKIELPLFDSKPAPTYKKLSVSAPDEVVMGSGANYEQKKTEGGDKVETTDVGCAVGPINATIGMENTNNGKEINLVGSTGISIEAGLLIGIKSDTKIEEKIPIKKEDE